MAEPQRISSPAPDSDFGSSGYVGLRTQPYRGHWLLIDRVLRVTRPDDVVFDGGVSSGYLAAQLVAEGRRVHGAELDPKAAEAARGVCEKVVVGDLQQLRADQLDGGFSVLLFGDTLEHLPTPEEVLRRLRPTLRPDGHLVVSVPNIANWAIRLGLLFGRFRYTERGIMDRTHLRFYTKKTLGEMVESAGYSVTEIVGSVPVPFVRTESICRLAHRIGNLRPSFFAYGLVLTARPSSS